MVERAGPSLTVRLCRGESVTLPRALVMAASPVVDAMVDGRFSERGAESVAIGDERVTARAVASLVALAFPGCSSAVDAAAAALVEGQQLLQVGGGRAAVAEIWAAAEFLRADAALAACERWAEEGLTPATCVELLRVAVEWGLPTLRRLCVAAVRKELQALVDLDEDALGALDQVRPPGTLKQILG